ncbi:uncharacterized protein [Primulina eburnea]|uniref:uncharacterized protein n=1 Tax=Primulina eburnea TaxID=1245227 RepID=UPI003C6C8959
MACLDIEVVHISESRLRVHYIKELLDVLPNLNRILAEDFVKHGRVTADEEAVANMRNGLPLEDAVGDELEAVRELEEHELEVGRGMLLEDNAGGVEPIVVLNKIMTYLDIEVVPLSNSHLRVRYIKELLDVLPNLNRVSVENFVKQGRIIAGGVGVVL